MLTPLAELAAALQRTLGATEAAAPVEVRSYQSRLLENLLYHARQNVPFYRDTGRLEPLFRNDGTVDFTRWSRVKVLTRSEALDNCDALLAERVPRDMLPLGEDCSTGADGEPLPFRRTATERVMTAALMGRGVGWHGAGPVERLAILRPTGDAKPSWQDDIGAGTPLVIATELPAAVQADALRRAGASHVLGRASSLCAVATVLGAPLDGLRLVIQTGDTLLPEARLAITTTFGAPVMDVYASSELGPVAIAGPDGRYRVSEESVLVDRVGGSAAHRLVATPLHAYGMPLIRYAPGDFVRFSGRVDTNAPGLGRLAQVIGRARSLFRRADGTLFAPNLSGWSINRIARVRRWRLTQRSIDSAVLEVRLAAPARPEQLAALEVLVARAVAPMQAEVLVTPSLSHRRSAGEPFVMEHGLVWQP